MSAIQTIKNCGQTGLKLANSLFFLAPTATRLVLGLTFMGTGMGKWQNFQNTVSFFTDLGIPFPEANAAFIAMLELVGGAALLAGFLTRLFSLGLAATMVVALMTADKEAFLQSWTSSSTSPTDVVPFTFLLFLTWLIVAGPGPLSLDHLLRRILGVERRSESGATDGAKAQIA